MRRLPWGRVCALHHSSPAAAPAAATPAAAAAAALTSFARGLAAAAAPPRARVLDGRAVAADWSDQLQAEVAALTAQIGRAPGLAVVLVGDRPDSCLYVSRKQEAAARAGIACAVHRLPQDVSQAAICARVAALCADAAVDGVLVQLPLPKHLDEEVGGVGAWGGGWGPLHI
jgi:hypothetical protein